MKTRKHDAVSVRDSKSASDLPAYGVPARIILDNGREFRAAIRTNSGADFFTYILPSVTVPATRFRNRR